MFYSKNKGSHYIDLSKDVAYFILDFKRIVLAIVRINYRRLRVE